MDCGIQGKPRTFVITDTQIMYESFLEDINNILNTGDITNMYKPDEEQLIANEMIRVIEENKLKDVGEKWPFYISRLRDNFHIIMCMSPIGDQLRIRCRKFPSLVNCCTLDWFDNWPAQALQDVAHSILEKQSDLLSASNNQRIVEVLSEMFMGVHQSVEDQSEKFHARLRRKVYTTPKSYLDAIGLYIKQLKASEAENHASVRRLQDGIHKLKGTNDIIEELKKKLEELAPQLKDGQEKAEVKAKDL